MTNSTTPQPSYIWVTPDQTALGRIEADGTESWIPADPSNCDYAEFLESGAVAAAYVAPPEPPPLTTEQKVDKLLSDYGLTRDEMRAALNAKSS